MYCCSYNQSKYLQSLLATHGGFGRNTRLSHLCILGSRLLVGFYA